MDDEKLQHLVNVLRATMSDIQHDRERAAVELAKVYES